jgi:hypothetical protein
MKLPHAYARRRERQRSRSEVFAAGAMRHVPGNTPRRPALGIKPATFCLDLCKGLTGDDYIECIRRC